MIECKSSQNMLIPNEFSSLESVYNAAVSHRMETESPARPQGWSQLCHPLGQLLAYMVDNGVRFGALCSASKTFFIFLEGQNNEIGLVRITEAYITAQRDFLKAWASFVQEARTYGSQEETKFSLPENWLKLTPLKNEDQKEGCQIEIKRGSDSGPDRDNQDGSDKPDGNGAGGGGGGSAGNSGSASGSRKRRGIGESRGRGRQGQSQKKRSHFADEAETESDFPPLKDLSPESVGAAEAIPHLFERYDFEEEFVDFYDPDDFEIGKVLGHGRNGDVFSSDYHGEAVAVKQFDLSKNFDSYRREVEGYKFLRKAWGELVPTPKFIGASRSGMVRFLGLQQGTKPDDDSDVEFDEALEKLRKLHHFTGGGNAIYVGEDSARKLLVIDLESWEDTRNRFTGKPAPSTPLP
jgi:hypothetical protein